MSRRQFVKVTGAVATACGAGLLLTPSHAAPENVPTFKDATASHLPRWRGFNLLEKFTKRRDGNSPFSETDFAWIAELGFDFVRLPMSYLCWTDASDWLKLREDELKHIDDAVDWGRKHGIHVNMNFHRAPGYCVNPPKEPLDLWTDEKALEACAFHWAHFAKRYKGIPNSRVSFDLLNEPGDIPEDRYGRVVRRLVGAIRAEDPDRLVIADGLRWGNKPVLSLADLKIAQSTRGYQPSRISHYKANWMQGSDKWPEPTWPLTIKEGDVWDKERLRKEQIEPWKALQGRGAGVHVGEWGAYQFTPHPVVLAWMRDYLGLWKEAGWGWSMWNFRGSFGILDSNRQDVAYEDWHGHKLDRQMVELIQAF
jgi:endoglucanase